MGRFANVFLGCAMFVFALFAEQIDLLSLLGAYVLACTHRFHPLFIELGEPITEKTATEQFEHLLPKIRFLT